MHFQTHQLSCDVVPPFSLEWLTINLLSECFFLINTINTWVVLSFTWNSGTLSVPDKCLNHWLKPGNKHPNVQTDRYDTWTVNVCPENHRKRKRSRDTGLILCSLTFLYLEKENVKNTSNGMTKTNTSSSQSKGRTYVWLWGQHRRTRPRLALIGQCIGIVQSRLLSCSPRQSSPRSAESSRASFPWQQPVDRPSPDGQESTVR